jgi:hypothetical protein
MLILSASPVYAFDIRFSGFGEKWDKTEKGLGITWQVIHILDWGTTLNIASNPDKYYELNPGIGTHPSRARVNLYMASSAILQPIVTHYIPKTTYLEIFGETYKIPTRKAFQSVSIGVSSACVINNFSIGLKLDF